MTPMTLHERIRSDIEGQILSGALKPGDKIPSELELMERYGCSRMTVNKALSTLSGAGLLQRRKRAGTVVAARPTESMVLDVPDLPVEIGRRGQLYRFHLLHREARFAAADAADERKLVGAGRLLHVRGVHLADDVAFAFEDRFVSLAAVPQIEHVDFTAEPPGSWLLHHIPWTEAENRIGAIAASREWAGHLGIETGAPCLSIVRRTWRGDEGITLVRQKFVAGQFELVARFGAS
jgi:GntR family transcriptional regulator, histidine utilization repressor